jgi:hypothetical protein
MGVHPQLANADLAVYGDLAVGRVLILNKTPCLRGRRPSTVRDWGVDHTDLQLDGEIIKKALQPVGRVSVVSPRIR